MSTPPPPYALVLDDHPLVARGMAEFLRAVLPGTEVIALDSASGLAPALAAHGAPRLAVVDFWLADGAALAALQTLRLHCPATPVAVVSGDDDPQLVERARAAGARGFLHKQERPETFAKAVRTLCAGGPWFPEPAAQGVALRLRELPVTPQELGLSLRQGEVLARVLQGQPNKRIAQALDISEATVKEHVTGILQKLGVRTRVEAITHLRGRQLVLPCDAR